MASLIFIIFYYYKTVILNHTLVEINFSFFSSALAQVSPPSRAPILKNGPELGAIQKKIEQRPTVKLGPLFSGEYFQIIPKFEFSGFNLYFFIAQNQLEKNIELLKKEWGSCVIKDPYLFTLSMALIKRQIIIKNEIHYRPLLFLAEKCKNKLGNNYSSVLGALSLKRGLNNSLGSLRLNEQEKKRIGIIESYQKEREQKFNHLYQFLTIFKNTILKKSENMPTEIFEMYKIFRPDFKLFPYYSSFTHLMHSLQIKNRGWNIDNLDKLIALDPEMLIFETPTLSLWKTILDDLKIENIDLEAMVMMIHDKIDTHFDFQKDQDIKMLFSMSILPLLNSNQDRLIEKYNLNLSSAQLKKMLSSPRLALTNPGPWIHYLAMRKEGDFLKTFLDSFNQISHQKFITDQNFWSLANLLISPERKQDFVVNYLKNCISLNSAYCQYFFLQIQSKEYYKNLIKDLDPEGGWGRAFFQIERDFYYKNLEKGIAVDYAIYKLFQLGDTNPLHLWWLVL